MKSKSIRLTPNSYAVLALLDQLGEGTSYELKQAIEVSIQNFWPVPHTTAYEEPARLASGGYLTARQEEGGRRRRVYSLTDSGREALAAWAAEPTASPPQLREEAVLKVFAGGASGPLLKSRVAWHLGKIEELEGLLRGVRDAEGWERSERTLRVGIVYHRKMLEMIEEVAPPED
ncbi:MAG TPA: helix-turn-helix transcriptional regulator [Solirubrobacterales bacterium]|nr:helix-turn-helix transcriptional regulator [Solirubrobacterales bacterium]